MKPGDGAAPAAASPLSRSLEPLGAGPALGGPGFSCSALHCVWNEVWASDDLLHLGSPSAGGIAQEALGIVQMPWKVTDTKKRDTGPCALALAGAEIRAPWLIDRTEKHTFTISPSQNCSPSPVKTCKPRV